MSETETRITDVRLEQNKLRLVVGLLLISIGILFAFLDTSIGKLLSIIGAIFFGIIGSYVLATSQRIGKDIAIKLMETVRIKASIKAVKINGNKNNVGEIKS